MEGKTAGSRWNRLLGFQGRDLWKLFSNAGVLTHIWTFILFLRDFSWLNERTNVWDAFAVGAYGLVTAFIESIFVFPLIEFYKAPAIVCLKIVGLVFNGYGICLFGFFIFASFEKRCCKFHVDKRVGGIHLHRLLEEGHGFVEFFLMGKSQSI